jgi:hypothetical protein
MSRYDKVARRSQEPALNKTGYQQEKTMTSSCKKMDPGPEAKGSNPTWLQCLDHSEAFFKSLEFGRIRGIIVLASDDSQSKQGPKLIPLVQELIKRDILVVISGNAAAEVEGAERTDASIFEQADTGLQDLCDFIGISPVIYMHRHIDCAEMLDFYHRQAELTGKTIRDLPFTAMKLPSTLAPEAALAPLEAVHGSLVCLDADFESNADLVEDHIHERRLALEWCDRFYCTEVAYS